MIFVAIVAANIITGPYSAPMVTLAKTSLNVTGTTGLI